MSKCKNNNNKDEEKCLSNLSNNNDSFHNFRQYEGSKSLHQLKYSDKNNQDQDTSLNNLYSNEHSLLLAYAWKVFYFNFLVYFVKTLAYCLVSFRIKLIFKIFWSIKSDFKLTPFLYWLWQSWRLPSHLIYFVYFIFTRVCVCMSMWLRACVYGELPKWWIWMMIGMMRMQHRQDLSSKKI